MPLQEGTAIVSLLALCLLGPSLVQVEAQTIPSNIGNNITASLTNGIFSSSGIFSTLTSIPCNIVISAVNLTVGSITSRLPLGMNLSQILSSIKPVNSTQPAICPLKNGLYKLNYSLPLAKFASNLSQLISPFKSILSRFQGGNLLQAPLGILKQLPLVGGGLANPLSTILKLPTNIIGCAQLLFTLGSGVSQSIIGPIPIIPTSGTPASCSLFSGK